MIGKFASLHHVAHVHIRTQNIQSEVIVMFVCVYLSVLTSLNVADCYKTLHDDSWI